MWAKRRPSSKESTTRTAMTGRLIDELELEQYVPLGQSWGGMLARSNSQDLWMGFF